MIEEKGQRNDTGISGIMESVCSVRTGKLKRTGLNVSHAVH